MSNGSGVVWVYWFVAGGGEEERFRTYGLERDYEWYGLERRGGVWRRWGWGMWDVVGM